ncbi:GGDEF domain-containing protein [Pelagibacterium sp. 26DY04]|uniref:GGDEF domain-containing protein n=1 Tax=Pelagibacterium sp. 26DY04 TaxID=2967130 RepID=UPI0028165BC6|nr:GGDEF domain-containing protein [Pelagibacterium sp. 26DY04]WMT86091.1 GGDEF domain-containing protein [Pelagibacterium sp. 26DY04]
MDVTQFAGDMGLDYNSLLMASGAAGIALCFTLASSWLRQRGSSFLFTWAMCIAIIIVAIIGFSTFHATAQSLHAVVAGVLLTTAFALSYGALTQFRDDWFDARTVIVLALAGAAPIVTSAFMGFDGLSFIFINVMCAILLSFCGYHYWTARAESPGPITAIVVLHAMLAVSFALCVVVMALETPLYLGGRVPDNWAESLNLFVSVIAITGIGGLFVTIHQERISRRHQAESLIDPLTGLNNRRALFERFPTGLVVQGTALVVFDLDDFKGLNDRNGHAFGDLVLCNFARMLAENVRDGDIVVRLGGEEFLIVLPESSSSHALALAERVRGLMSRMVHQAGDQAVTCTVSAGVALAEKPQTSLDTLLRKADNALYLSKRSGRNRVSQNVSSAA